jgi:hypothetical protein
LLGAAGSAVLALGVVILAEQRRPAFHSVEDLRAFTTLPVLVRIPRIVTERDLRQGRRWTRLATASALVGLTIIAGLTYVLAQGNEQLVWLLARGRF